MAVVVVTDSSASLPAELIGELNIRVVPLHVLLGDREIRDGIDELEVDYAAETVTTSAPSPGELRDAYTAALTRSGGDGVVAVHLSRQLSATWEAGRQAVRDMDTGESVLLVDSLGAGLATGFPVLAAARCAAAGGTLEEVREAAMRTARSSHTFFVVNRTEQLRRGGRLSTAASFFGSELVGKPVLQLVQGRLELREKARTRSKAFAKLVAAAEEVAGVGDAAIGVQHLGAAEAAESVTTQLRERIPQAREILTAEFGPALAVHLGVGAVGVLILPGGCG